MLTVHATIEEEFFYPAARRAGVDPDLRRLILTESDRRTMGIGSIGVVPGAVLLLGAGVWFRRRKR